MKKLLQRGLMEEEILQSSQILFQNYKMDRREAPNVKTLKCNQIKH